MMCKKEKQFSWSFPKIYKNSHNKTLKKIWNCQKLQMTVQLSRSTLKGLILLISANNDRQQ